MNSVAAAKRVGVSYRQLDHWYRRGFLGDNNVGLGSGYQRQVTRDEFTRLQRLAALVHAGLRPDAAADLIDKAETTDSGLRLVVGNVTIDLHEPTADTLAASA